jgi:hypothetical protein
MTTALAGTRDLILAAAALLDWAREHTGPHDPNSPHALLIALQAALTAQGCVLAPNGSTILPETTP